MTPEERDLLTKSIRIAEENNKMLRGLRTRARLSFFLRIIYWLIIIGSVFGAYYFVKPFIDPIISGYNGLQENIQSIKDTTTKLPSLPSWLGGKK